MATALRSPFGCLLAALPGAALLYGHYLVVRPAFIDDSYIFYRYAANWADGLGLVFNRGEHVEGYSSFLWTAILTLVDLTGAEVPRAAPVVATSLAMAAAIVAAFGARMLLGGVLVPAVSAIAVALCSGLAFFAAAGMDSALFALVLALSVVVVAAELERPSTARAAAAALCMALLVLVRAEGFAYALLIGVVALIASRRRGEAVKAPLAVAAVATVVVFVIRRAIYHVWLPATVTAKGYFGHALGDADFATVGRLLKDGLSYEGPVLLGALVLIAAVVVVRLRRGAPLPPLVALAAAAVVLNLVVTLTNGGDWMGHDRLVVPVVPLLVLLGGWAADEAVSGRGPAFLRAGPAAAVLGCLLIVPAVGFHPSGESYDPRLRAIGIALHEARPPARLITNVNGQVSYYAGSRTYVWDLLGLTDAHNSRHGDVFSARYGRTDPEYDYTRPFDVFVSNAAADVTRMVRVWDGRPAYFRRYVLLAPSNWAERGLYVVARRGIPLTRRLEALCRCRGSAFTPALRTRLAREGLAP